MRLGLPRQRDFIRASGGRAREPVDAKTKKLLKARAKNKCEWKGCKEREVLQVHHKNMKNDDNRLSNLILLCPTHHMKTHNRFKRVVYDRDGFGSPTRARVVKRSKIKKKRKRSPFDFI